MTLNEFYTEIAACEALSDEARAIAQKHLDKEATKNAAKNDERDALIEALMGALTDTPQPSADIAAKLEITSAKAVYWLNTLVAQGKAQKTPVINAKKSKVNGYSL